MLFLAVALRTSLDVHEIGRCLTCTCHQRDNMYVVLVLPLRFAPVKFPATPVRQVR